MNDDYTIHDNGTVEFSDGTRVPSISGGNMGQSTSQQTQTKNVAPMSGAELALQNVNVPAMTQQTGTLQDAINRLNTYLQSPSYQTTLSLGNQANQNLQAMLGQGGMTLSPQQMQFLQQAYLPVEQQQMNLLRQQYSDAAAGRGLALTDTAIAQPFALGESNLAAQMGSSMAQSGLQLGQTDAQFNAALAQYADSQRAAQQQQGLAFSQATPPGYQYGLALGQQRLNAAPVSQTGTSNAPWTQSLAYLGSAIGGRNGLWDPAVGLGRGLFGGGAPAQGTPGQPGYVPAVSSGLLRPAVDAAGNFISSGAKDAWGSIFGGGTSGPQPGYQMPANTYGGSSFSLGPQGNFAPDASLSMPDTSSSSSDDAWGM